MKKSIKYFGVLFMILISATLMKAQHPQHRMNKQGFDHLKSELDLSEAQQTELKKLREENRIKREMILNDEKISKDEKRASMRQIREDQKQAMEKILSEEQKVKLESIKKEKAAERKEKMQHRKEMHKARMSEMKQIRKEFDQKLSAEDREKIEAFKLKRAQQKSEIKTIEKENTELRKQKMEEFKKANEQERAEIKLLGEKYDAEIKAFMKEKGFEKRNPDQMEMKNKGLKGDQKTRHKKDKEFKKHLEKRAQMKKLRKEKSPERFLLMDFDKG